MSPTNFATRLDNAYEFGYCWRANGNIARSPALDSNITGLIADLAPGQGADKILRAWHIGYNDRCIELAN